MIFALKSPLFSSQLTVASGIKATTDTNIAASEWSTSKNKCGILCVHLAFSQLKPPIIPLYFFIIQEFCRRHITKAAALNYADCLSTNYYYDYFQVSDHCELHSTTIDIEQFRITEHMHCLFPAILAPPQFSIRGPVGDS
jgi:hypothetical protein